MMSYGEILERALRRAGGEAALEAQLPQPAAAAELIERPDDRYFSDMSRRIFQAGLSHSMVNGKWPAFEEAFHGFDPRRVAAMTPDEQDALMADKRLIRHGGKMAALPANAAAMVALAQAHGGFGRYLADWPAERTVELWWDLAKRFKQMGGNSGPQFLRMSGKDTFVLTPDVGAMLVAAGALEREPKGKRDQATAQAAFNAWAAESGRPLCHLSKMLALARSA